MGGECKKAEEADAEAVNVGQDRGGGVVWVDEGRVEGSTVFVITLATELLCICHDSIEGKGLALPPKRKQQKNK